MTDAKWNAPRMPSACFAASVTGPASTSSACLPWPAAAVPGLCSPMKADQQAVEVDGSPTPGRPGRRAIRRLGKPPSPPRARAGGKLPPGMSRANASRLVAYVATESRAARLRGLWRVPGFSGGERTFPCRLLAVHPRQPVRSFVIDPALLGWHHIIRIAQAIYAEQRAWLRSLAHPGRRPGRGRRTTAPMF